jgi:hypothetical protein
MSDNQNKQRSPSDAELEREIRQGREFNLADAIGRMAGPGAMKGVSPVSRQQQAEAAIQDYLSRHLPDPSGNLRVALSRQVGGSEILLKSYDQPLAALADCVRRVLGSEQLLKELVREADVEWGRMFRERPLFEREGQPADPDDPYTIESVRTALAELVTTLRARPQ